MGHWKRTLVLIAAGIAFIIASSAVFYQITQSELFNERDSHLTTIALKVSDQISTVRDVGAESASMGAAFLADKPLAGEQDLFERLGELSDATERRGSLIVAFDDAGNYYTSTGQSGRWRDTELLSGSSDDIRYTIGTLPYDTVNSYFFTLAPTAEPLFLGPEGPAVTYVAMASNMDAVQSMINVTGFGDQCRTYIVTPDGGRIYQYTYGEHFLAKRNVLESLEEFRFIRGGTVEDLARTVASGETDCYEFLNGDGAAYFVAATGIEGGSLLLFVPTDVLSANEGSYLVSYLVYFCILAVTVILLVGAMVSTLIRSRTDRRRIAEQEKTNRALQTERDRAEAINRELEVARDRAESANRAKSSFLSNMSHDIRTPMNAIIGFTALAADHADEPDKVREYLAKIDSSSNHLLGLINDILDMSKIEHGKLQLTQGECDLSLLLHGLADMVADRASVRQLHLITDVDGLAHRRVIADPLRLNQVLINIVGNAIKYTQEGGTVIIRASEGEIVGDGEGRGPATRIYRFIVEDTGPGMSPEFLPHLFDAFTREPTGKTSQIQGTGLGLAITKNLVDLMGGTIEVESELGRGSRFTVAVPLTEASLGDGRTYADAAEAAGDFQGASDKKVLEGLHLLLAEDTELNALVVMGILEDKGITVDWVEDGAQAVEALKAAKPGTYDGILMDARMPVLDGYGASRAIRALDDGRRASIPIIALTANAFEEDKRKALDAGMNAHVPKPISTKLLLDTIAGLMGKEA